MNDKKLYERILGLTSPWYVGDVKMDISTRSLTIKVKHRGNARFRCPECNKYSSIHDHRIRSWRHLPTCQFRTIIEASIPRVKCSEHGVRQVPVPWAEENSGFTALFESLVILWLKEANINAVANLMGLTWDQVNGIQKRAVKRGISRRKSHPTDSIGIDETSFKKNHDYVTVINDRNTGKVLDVLEDRKQDSLSRYFTGLSNGELDEIETISMDMWDPYIAGVRDNFENWDEMICFDRYHVSQKYGNAVDKTRIQEHRAFNKKYRRSILTNTKHSWLRNSSRTDNRSRRWFMALTRSNLKTSRAWAIKETASKLWHYNVKGHARRGWDRLLGWMRRSRLPAVVDLYKTIKRYLWGIVNAVVHNVDNSKAEAINSRIQWIKKISCGFRSKERFRNAILFHLGGLNLMPKNIQPTHLIS